MDVIPTTDALDEPTVMRQIRKLVEITDQNIQEFADTVNEGTYKSVSVTGPVNGKYTLNFVNQNDETESFEFLIKDIKTVASSQSGSTVTLTLTYSNNTTQTFTWTAGGNVTTDTAQNITAVKTFTVSPIVPTTPSAPGAAINMGYVSKTDGSNNLLHTSANEVSAGIKQGIWRGYILDSPIATTQQKWLRYCSFNASYTGAKIEIYNRRGNNSIFYTLFILAGGGGYQRTTIINKVSGSGNNMKILEMINEDNNAHEIWIYVGNSVGDCNGTEFSSLDGVLLPTYINEEYDSLPESGYKNPVYLVGSE